MDAVRVYFRYVNSSMYLLGFLYKAKDDALRESHVRPAVCLWPGISAQTLAQIFLKFRTGDFH
jgi:hypothetical protein